MRVTLGWLAEFLPGIGAVDDLAGLLTGLGLEVEASGRAAPALPRVVAGRVTSTHRLPGTKAKACVVNAGPHRLVEVVCGAPNARRGVCAPLALPGAALPSGVAVAAHEVHGHRSAGMLCSAAEVGLGDDAAMLLELGRDARPGTPLDELVATADTVIDVAVTPNRGDWLSMLGVAREVAAKLATDPGRQPLRLRTPRRGRGPAGRAAPPPAAAAFLERFTQPATIDAAAQAACPRFTCLPIAGVKADAPTPAWIRERLRRCGVRPVSVIVDITNYVMLELGQPLHAFDGGKLAGPLHVRHARAGERLTLIDGTDARLTERMLVVADADRAQAIGGVMGGQASEVTAATTAIVLEAAHFTPATVRGRTRELNITSEAAFRFERGVDPTLCETALLAAARLVVRHCGGHAGTAQVTGAAPPPPAPVHLGRDRVSRLTGVDVGLADAAKRLKALGFAVTRGRDGLAAVPPPWRFDIAHEVDLVEEVVRLGGYADLPVTLPALTGMFRPVPDRLVDATLARDRLVADGFNEVITYAFVNPAWERRLYANEEPLRLRNPLAEEMAVMRSGLLGGLLDRAVHNANRRQPALKLFEIGRCFPPADGRQPHKLALLAWGPVGADHWAAPRRAHDLHDLAGTLARLLPGAAVRLAADGDPPALRPGRRATVHVDGTPVGMVGELHPSLVGKHGFDLTPAPVVAELDLDVLAALPRARPARPYSRLPLVRRDLAVVVDGGVPAGQLVDAAWAAAHDGTVVAVTVFDSYASAGLGPGKRGIGLRVTMQGTEHNLVDDQINATLAAISARLAATCGAVARG